MAQPPVLGGNLGIQVLTPLWQDLRTGVGLENRKYQFDIFMYKGKERR